MNKIESILQHFLQNKVPLYIAGALVFLLIVFINLTGTDLDGTFFVETPDRAIWFGVALRVFSGQLPHLDFSSTIGPGIPLLYGSFLKLLGDKPSSLFIGSSIATLSYCLTYLVLNLRRWNLLLHSIFFLSVVIHVAYPVLNYNHLGYFFVLNAVFEAFTWNEARSWRNSGWLFGGFTAFIFFAKYIFFFQGMAVLLLAFLWKRPSAKWLISFLSGFVFVLLLFFAVINFELTPLLNDLNVSREIRGSLVLEEFRKASYHIRYFHKYIWGFLLFTLPLWYHRKKVLNLNLPWQFFLFPIYLFGLQNALLLSGSNWPHPYGREWLAVILCCLVQPYDDRLSRALKFLVFISFFCWSVKALYLNYIQFNDGKIGEEVYAQRNLCTENLTYPCSVQDGINLWKKNTENKKPILLLTYEDPLTPYLRLPALRGDLTHWSHIDSFSSENYPDPEMLADQVDYIFEPVYYASVFHKQAFAIKKKIFEEIMTNQFYILDENRSWKLWKRQSKISEQEQ